MNSAARIALAAFVLAGAAWFALRQFGPEAARAPDVLVEDGAGLMTPEQRAFVAEYHRYLLADFDLDYRVVTAAAAGDINRYAVERFDALSPNVRSRTGRLLLLVVDPKEDKVRLEVGYALEGVFPDAFVAYVEERQMVPFFRAGRVADGILATTELIITRAQKAAAGAGFDGENWTAGTGGAGATTKANLGAGPEPMRPRSDGGAAPGATPEAALAAYLGAMQAHDRRPDLEIYTEPTRDMLRRWTVTRAQMDNVVRTYRACHAEQTRLGAGGSRAVIRYPIRERACAPWFFRRSGSGWQIDLTMMQGAIRFGRSNAWRFDMAVEHPYRFAFADWTFDTHGFPKRRR